jgi:hypothetical protein
MIAVGESAGRARAAAELSRMGMHDEAKALMLDGVKKWALKHLHVFTVPSAMQLKTSSKAS